MATSIVEAKTAPPAATFYGLPDETLLLVYSQLIEILLAEGSLESYWRDYIHKYLRTAIDMRTHKIAVEAFANSSFFENFTLQVKLNGSMQYWNRLREYGFIDRHLERAMVVRAVNPFFKNDQDGDRKPVYSFFQDDGRAREWWVNCYNQPVRKELFGCFPRTVFARMAKKVQFRLRTEVLSSRYYTESVELASDEWLLRFVREMWMIMKHMPKLEEVSIGRDYPGLHSEEEPEQPARLLEEKSRELVKSTGLRLTRPEGKVPVILGFTDSDCWCRGRDVEHYLV